MSRCQSKSRARVVPYSGGPRTPARGRAVQRSGQRGRGCRRPLRTERRHSAQSPPATGASAVCIERATRPAGETSGFDGTEATSGRTPPRLPSTAGPVARADGGRRPVCARRCEGAGRGGGLGRPTAGYDGTGVRSQHHRRRHRPSGESGARWAEACDRVARLPPGRLLAHATAPTRDRSPGPPSTRWAPKARLIASDGPRGHWFNGRPKADTVPAPELCADLVYTERAYEMPLMEAVRDTVRPCRG